jgi:hypothetical protein
MKEDRPGFLWDRTLDDAGFRALLGSADDSARLWAVRRLLEYGEWDEIWRYLTLADVRQALPRLRFRSPETASFWQEAVAFWSDRAP